MELPDNVLKQKLHNVYFIWGSGKTTAAHELSRRYGFYVYHTDGQRANHFRNADPAFQPALCREVPDVWALAPEDAREWEAAIVREFTPMVVADLLQLAALHEAVICEGDIDIDGVMPIVTHAVTITHRGRAYDFFDRPDQRHMLEQIRSRSDLTPEQKEERIRNAYQIVRGGVGETPDRAIPRETRRYGVKQIIRDDGSTPERTADAIAAHFGWPGKP